MFIGASPGSTGGGIKTTTFFVLLQGIKSAATNRSEKAFRYSVPVNAFRKASVILLMGLTIVLTGSFIMSALEPGIDMSDILLRLQVHSEPPDFQPELPVLSQPEAKYYQLL